MSAHAISFTAFMVSRSGSPGPAPTSHTVPGAKSSRCIACLLGQYSCKCRTARPAIGAGPDRCADRGNVGELLVADRRGGRLPADVETDADDRDAVGRSAGCTTG